MDGTAVTMANQPWIVDGDFDRTTKDMEYPTAPVHKVASRQQSVNHLRLNTYSKEFLHDRYMSSEEEPSPSPDSETASGVSDDEELEPERDAEQEPEHEEEQLPELEPEEELLTTATALADKATDDIVEFLDYSAEIAIAVPIMAIGRPKLVDITNIAPMHKRKRSLEKSPPLMRTAVHNAASRIPATADEDIPSLTHKDSIYSLVEPTAEPALMEQPEATPESWLPEESDVSTVTDDGEDEHYFPELEVRAPLSYKDYDPYSLNPPKLSPRTTSHERAPTLSSSSASTGSKKPGSIARARKNANASNNMLRRANARISSHSHQSGSTSSTQTSWKGLTRSLSMAKKSETNISTPPSSREAKKPKMQARGPTEREELPTIPPFPFESTRGDPAL